MAVNDLTLGRAEPHQLTARDLRDLPLRERKRHLARIMPRVGSRVMLLTPIERRGCRLFELAGEHDLKGVVAKWAHGTYQSDGGGTSCLKIKNREYSQAEGRHELFEDRHIEWGTRRQNVVGPTLKLS
jgi:ATP-dependent DNA ligase